MKRSTNSELEFQLKKLFLNNLETFQFHQWPQEELRWTELAFALISTIKQNYQNNIRDIVNMLYELELLNVDKLAEIKHARGKLDIDASSTAKQINQILLESGLFTEEESGLSILTLSEAAKSLKEHYDGKIQRYLRKYGQMMIDESEQNFKFTKLNKNDARYAFTFWLQNVLNMPISLQAKSVEEFCRALGVTPEELIAAADKLDINIAVLDDVVNNWDSLRKSQETASEIKEADTL